MQGARAAHDLAVAAVALGDVDADGDGLVRLVGHDLAEAHLGRAGAVLGGRRALALRRLLRALLLAAPAARDGLGLAHLEALLGRGRATPAALGARRDAALLRRQRRRLGLGGLGRGGLGRGLLGRDLLARDVGLRLGLGGLRLGGRGDRLRVGVGILLVSHRYRIEFVSRPRSRATVIARARSRLAVPTPAVFSSSPVASWKRRPKTSRRWVRMCSTSSSS
jgi:hypothetical protein